MEEVSYKRSDRVTGLIFLTDFDVLCEYIHTAIHVLHIDFLGETLTLPEKKVFFVLTTNCSRPIKT